MLASVVADFVSQRITSLKPYERPDDAEVGEIQDRMVAALVSAAPHAVEHVLAVDGAVDRAWEAEWLRWREDHAERVGARYALRVALSRDELSRVPGAERELERELRERSLLDALRALEATIGRSSAAKPVNAGIAVVVAAVLTHIESNWGSHGAAAAASLRQQMAKRVEDPGTPRRRVSAWISAPRSTLATWIAPTVWRAVVRPALLETRRRPPALAATVIERLATDVWSPQLRCIERLGGLAVLAAGGREVASVASIDAEKLEMAQRGVRALRSLTAHRTIRWLVEEAHRQYVCGMPNPAIIVVEGGLEGLRHKVGSAKKGDNGSLRDILTAGWLLKRRWPGNVLAGLWTFGLEERTRGRPAVVRIALAPILAPGFVHSMSRHENRFLVPLVPMPPFVSRPKERAPQAALQMALLVALVERRVEIVEHGGALIRQKQMASLALRVGLPPSILNDVLARWTRDGDDGPAFLEQVGLDRWHVAANEVHLHARLYIEKAGKISVSRSEAQRKSRRRRPL